MALLQSMMIRVVLTGIFCLLPQLAHAQSITVMDNLVFGTLMRPSATGVVAIETDGSIAFGSENVVTPGDVRAGRYRINGTNGLIDIAVTGTSTCDAGVVFSQFPAQFNAQHFANIAVTPIVGVPFADGDELSLGARIHYTQFVPLNLCPATFDLTITVY